MRNFRLALGRLITAVCRAVKELRRPASQIAVITVGVCSDLLAMHVLDGTWRVVASAIVLIGTSIGVKVPPVNRP
jgi:hypothetical protein